MKNNGGSVRCEWATASTTPGHLDSSSFVLLVPDPTVVPHEPHTAADGAVEAGY